MPGKHKFVPPTVAGGVAICEHCGENKTDLDGKRVEGKLPSCLDAPDETFQSHTAINVRTRYRLLLTISSAKVYGGVRSILFDAAVALDAFYNNDTNSHETSFYYVEDDIHVNLLFYSERDASTFASKMKSDLKYFRLSKCTIYGKTIEPVSNSNQELVEVDKGDYKNMEMGSPFLDINRSVSDKTRDSENSRIAKCRDHYTCLACGLSASQSCPLEAAHILDVEEVKAAKNVAADEATNLLKSVGLVSATQESNLLTLCTQCHNGYFDQHKICLNYNKDTKSFFWEVKDTVVDDDMPGQQGKYGDIQGKVVEFPFNNFPPPALIQHRMQEFLNNNGKKRKLVSVKIQNAVADFLTSHGVSESDLHKYDNIISKVKSLKEAKQKPRVSDWEQMEAPTGMELWFNKSTGQLKFRKQGG